MHDRKQEIMRRNGGGQFWSSSMGVNDIQPEHMMLFAIVMTSRTLSEAAERLHISQPAVTKAVRAMEAKSGLHLFDRRHARLTPTGTAVQLLPHVRAALIEIRATQRIARQLRRVGGQYLSIGATTTSLSSLIPMAVSAMRRRWPDCIVDVVAETAPGKVLDLVRKEQVRIGVAQVPSNETEPDSEHALSSVEICSDLLSVIIPIGHRLARLSVVRPQDLRDLDLIRGLRSESSVSDLVEEAFRTARVPLNIVVEASSSLAICSLVQANVGVGLASPMQLQGGIFGGLTSRPFSPRIRMKTAAYFRPKMPLSEREQYFLTALVELGGSK